MRDADRKLVIQVRDLRKSYDTHEVLSGIDLDIHEGEVLVIIGPSGSGKSTLLRCLNMLEVPSSGTVTVLGTQINARGASLSPVRRQIGMVFQHFNLWPHMNVLENVMEGPVTVLGMRRSEAMNLAYAQLRKVGLEELRAEVLDAMLELAREGMTMVIVTHEMSFARRVADRVVFLDGGVIVEAGSPREILTHPRTERLHRFLNVLLWGEDGVVDRQEAGI
jgi:polar amino acid transport system ATP-binding protein